MTGFPSLVEMSHWNEPERTQHRHYERSSEKLRYQGLLSVRTKLTWQNTQRERWCYPSARNDSCAAWKCVPSCLMMTYPFLSNLGSNTSWPFHLWLSVIRLSRHRDLEAARSVFSWKRARLCSFSCTKPSLTKIKETHLVTSWKLFLPQREQ